MGSTRIARTGGITAATAALVLSIVTPASAANAAPAGAGEWDYLGSSGVYEVNGQYYSDRFNSHGGNVKVCWTSNSTVKWYYGLYEYDEGNDDDKVGTTRTQLAGGCEEWNVDDYLDGDNGLAELYAVTVDPKVTKVEFWD
ncbi:hypothetical protein ACIRCZ_19935 [Leifsonia sp. NPDC102414]|uniref:hypothetical protein n=1 Tax=Leifsonia sp. NPDC102414 TaxID=3364124 RepID=UPI003803BFD4